MSARPSRSTSFFNLGEQFLEIARKRSNHPAIIQDNCQTTFGELSRTAQTIAKNLRQAPGWSVGDRVALQLVNSPSYAASFYGVLLAGGIVIPIPPALEDGRKQSILISTACRHTISGLPHELLPSIATTSGARVQTPDPPENLAAIFFTSGSTGVPKGVMLSHSNLLSNTAAIQQYLKIQETDRTLALLPFFHAFGNSVLQTHLLAGATLVMAGSIAYPETVVEALRRYQITSFSGVPDFFRLLLKHSRLGQVPIPQLRYVSVAGGCLKSELIQQLSARIAPAELFVMYGQTEATARLSYLPPKLLSSKSGSIGRGIQGVTLAVVDGHGNQISSGMTGEIRAKGPGVMLGYWNDPEGTRAILRNGWLHTGDLGTVDDEGFIYPRGRANTLFKVAGYRVHPADIEGVIGRLFPDTEVVAVPFEAVSSGTRVAIFMTSLRSDVPIDVRSVRAACMTHLARHLLPAHIEILDQWPLNSACKVDRATLSARAIEACLR